MVERFDVGGAAGRGRWRACSLSGILCQTSRSLEFCRLGGLAFGVVGGKVRARRAVTSDLD